jgi:hypothetical protein
MHLQIQRPGSAWEEATSNLKSGLYTIQAEPKEMSQSYRFRFVYRGNEVWGNQEWSVVVTGTNPPIPGDEGGDGGLTTGDKGIPIFPSDRQEVLMFWYKILAGLSGAFIFLIMIKSGYQHMTNPNPANRASLIETIQMSVIGLLIISFAPMFVTLLININNGFVDLCLDTYNALTASAPVDYNQTAQMGKTEWMDRFVAAPIRAVNDLIVSLFGLAPLGEVVFNEAPTASILSNNKLFEGDINVGNELGTALVSLALLGFTVYYNAVYTIRRWVVTAALGATPIIVWIWVLSGRRQVIDIWLSELIQTIFMQSFHALTFGIFFSILCFTGNPGMVNSQFAQMMVEVGKFLAAFGGVICFGMIVLQGFKIIVASEEKSRAEAIGIIKKSLLGLTILGLAAMIASFLAQNPLIIHFPKTSGEETKITLWQLFFVLLAIIPVSKMFSMIFMNFLARIGTVDEDAWAMKGLGIMGGMVALGKASAGALKNTPINPGSASAASTRTGSAAGSATGAASAAGSAGGAASARLMGASPGTGAARATEESGLGPPDTEPVYADPPMTSPDTEPVYADPPGRLNTPAEGATKKAFQIDPKAQQANFKQAVLNTRKTVDGAVGLGQKVGEAAGFAAPGSGKALGAFFGVGARVTTAPLATAHAIYGLGQNLPKGSRTLTNITGRENPIAAGVQVATAVLLSPIGNTANIALKTGSAIDHIKKTSPA